MVQYTIIGAHSPATYREDKEERSPEVNSVLFFQVVAPPQLEPAPAVQP